VVESYVGCLTELAFLCPNSAGELVPGTERVALKSAAYRMELMLEAASENIHVAVACQHQRLLP